ncbi:MAG TPA: DUF6569 family protein [Chthonomonadaceae bacterium]|nr:DUF6569 family protein [Chthonomonadaceae bacterium]
MLLIQDTLARLQRGEALTFRNLAVFPLLGEDGRTADYFTLDEALAQKVARITEVNAGGSVPELRFVNECDLQVLLMDGEELIGAKQNRTLNITILAPAHSTLLLPVTCVEQGRWASTSAEFASAPHAHYASGRVHKYRSVSASLRESGSHHADQGEVWADIRAKASRMAAPSPTHAMDALYERHETGVHEFQAALPAQVGQRGAVFAIDGKIIGVDLFDCPSTLRKLWPKIVSSYALDALDTASPDAACPVSPQSVDAFLKALARADAETFAAVGVGEDVRLTATGLTGGALVAEGRVVHLSAFAAGRPAEEEPLYSALSRASTRRFYWQRPR